ncbi:MAG TPA: peptide ABC transporter substrate-binding protein [Aliidongia sp.]|nr:peptide ABC transporter substrate-binding protein [Aliidongia sp.]
MTFQGWCRLLAVAALMLPIVAQAETVLRRGNHDEPETLDPQKSDGSQEYWIQTDLFEGLAKFDAEGKIVPGAAESWEASADGLTWIFHLRHGLEWSDGSPLTAEDFVWSLRRAVDPRTAAAYASILYPVVGAKEINDGREKDLAKLGVAAPDPLTVTFRLTQPTPFLAGVLTLGIAYPLPRRVIEAEGEGWTRPGKLVSNGPFMLAAWTPQLDLKLVRNPHYHAAAAVKLDAVVWSVNEEDETAVKRFRAGELDIARVPTKEVPALRREMPDALHTGLMLWTRYIEFNTGRPPFDDERLRNAVALLLDREAIAQQIDPHGEAPAYGLVPPGFAGYTQQPPDWIELSKADRAAKAKALLAEAGYGPSNRLKIEMVYPAAEDLRRILTAMAGLWRPYGIDLTPLAEENQVVETQTRNRDYQAAYRGWIADYPDPWSFLSVFRSDSGGLNSTAYNDPAFDALLDRAVAETDPAARMKLLESAERILSRTMPAVAVTYDTTPRLVSPHLKGYADNPLDQHPSETISLAP